MTLKIRKFIFNLQLDKKHGFLITGESDFHGEAIKLLIQMGTGINGQLCVPDNLKILSMKGQGMGNNCDISKAIELFDQQKYREALDIFTEFYNHCEDISQQQEIFQILEEAYYAPNREELINNYQHNLQLLKKYPYIWGETFPQYDELSFQLFPCNDEIFYCYDPAKDYFFGAYDAKTRHQMQYFFKDLNEPFLIENEDNFYNLTFLNDNVRASEDFAGDNHIYLYYTSLEPLERLMLTCDFSSILQQQKFVFLVGKKNRNKYPINFRKRYGVDYKKMKPSPLRIEEINRIYLNCFYAYSGTDFFQEVLNGSDYILVFNAWFLHTESDRNLIDTYFDYIGHPEQLVDTAEFLKFVQTHIEQIKIQGWPLMVACLPDILAGMTSITVHELWKAIAISAMQVSQKLEGKQYLSRISPIIFFDAHGASPAKYYELLKYFKYPGVEATIREPIMRLIRYFEVSGPGKNENLQAFRSVVGSTYVHSREIPRWLTDSGFYIAKFEDLKLKPKETLLSICHSMNFPYSERLLKGKGGLWSVRFTNEKGETLQGFDQRSVKRDISTLVTPEDQERLNIFYWPIHHYFRYPCTKEQPKITRAEAQELFSTPFYFEQVYAARRKAYLQALKTVPEEQKQNLQTYINKMYTVQPENLRAMLQSAMVEDCCRGFDDELVLPDVMFPLDETDSSFLSQSQRLNSARYDSSIISAMEKSKEQNANKVYWITGLSGAGKTTIGRLWYEKLKHSGENVIFLDGDELREAIADDLGFSEVDRRKSGMRNAKLCALLARQGLTVICCTISMFDTIREWNRKNIPGYFEVYVKVSMETLHQRDQKSLYSQERKDVAGIHIQVEEPKYPDLILVNDGRFTPEEQIEILWKTRNKGE